MSLQVGGTTLCMPRIISPDGSSAGLDHISANDLQALTALARQAPTDWLTARCADIALATTRITGRDIQQLAAPGARSPLRLAQLAAAEEITPQAVDHLRRALDLGWRGLRKDDAFQTELWLIFMAMFQSVLDGPMKGLATASSACAVSRLSATWPTRSIRKCLGPSLAMRGHGARWHLPRRSRARRCIHTGICSHLASA